MIDITVSSNVWSMLYALNGKCMCAAFDLYKLPKSELTNANILCLFWFGSGRNKLVQLLTWSQNSGGRTVL